LGLNQLDQLNWGNSPVDLLVLSACQTALGDKDAELGFAGLAINAGVRTALASLWEVNDAATLGLMTKFYQQLQVTTTKAEALRQAQLSMLRGEVRLEDGNLVTPNGTIPLTEELRKLGNLRLTHPYYWSAFTIVGNPW
jgi:CHAT domain-containing protein